MTAPRVHIGRVHSLRHVLVEGNVLPPSDSTVLVVTGLPDGADVFQFEPGQYGQADGRRVIAVVVEPAPAATTERVPWAKTPGRKLTDGREVQHVLVSRAGWVWLCHEGDARTRVHDPDALVEVLVEDES